MSFSQENNNCAWTAFVQGDSVGDSKLTEQTILVNAKPDHLPGRGFARSRDYCPGVGFSFSFLCRGGVGVLNSRNFLQFWKKNVGSSRFVSKKLEAA